MLSSKEVPWLVRQRHWLVGAPASEGMKMRWKLQVLKNAYWVGAAAAGQRSRGFRKQAENAKSTTATTKSKKEQIPIPSSGFAIFLCPYWQDLTRWWRKERKWLQNPSLPSHSWVNLQLRCNSLISGTLNYYCTNPFICKGLSFKFCILKAINMPLIKHDYDQGIL